MHDVIDKNKSNNYKLKDQIVLWIESYTKKAPTCIDFPLIFPSFPLFTQTVLQHLSQIPFGSTKSYGDVATKINAPSAFRAVGTACGRNPFPLLIPCHRVIAANGQLGGFAMDLHIKKALLRFENLEIPTDRKSVG